MSVSRLGLFGALALATLVRIPHLRFVPIWDGRNYWDDCVQPALLGNFDPLAFNCFGHRSMLYMLAVSWPQYFSHGSALLLNLAHLALSLLTIYAFHRIVTLLFEPGLDAALLTVIFAAMPIWTGPSLNLNPDCGVLVGFLFAIAFFLRGRLIHATAAGLFLVLSKEIGLLLWLALAGLDTLLAISKRGLSARERLRALYSRWILLLPAVAYVATGAALRAREMRASWVASTQQASLIRTFLSFDLTAPHFVAYATDIFVLNFAWLMTLFIIVWLFAVIVSALRRRPIPLPPTLNRSGWIFVALTMPVTLFLVTRFPTFNNVRYLLPAFPMLVIIFGVATAALIRKPALRTAVLVIAGCLQLSSMSRTIDPLSRSVFGEFPFGRHALLDMTSLTGECCGRGRDQLVYNLQFTYFDYTQSRMFEVIRPRDGEIVAIPPLAKWYLQGPLDVRNYSRTLRSQGIIRPRFVTLDDFKNGFPLPPVMRYIRYPNLDDRRELRILARSYEVRKQFAVEDDGYRLVALELVRRDPR